MSLMDEITNDWMAYINAEVRAVCSKRDWGYQVRRKWSVREKPVVESSVEDYEWKLIPGAQTRLPNQEPREFDGGIYFVLSLDLRRGAFFLQHDTSRFGDLGPKWNLESFTEIRLVGLGHLEYSRRVLEMGGDEHEGPFPVPQESGWLEGILTDLTSRFQPNHFSLT
jgi:hypothetical protein